VAGWPRSHSRPAALTPRRLASVLSTVVVVLLVAAFALVAGVAGLMAWRLWSATSGSEPDSGGEA
jgi:hypothetical protein